jgi:AcrR family transcriptional regulator
MATSKKSAAGEVKKTRIRVTKDPAVRREELLDITFDLCRSHGYAAIRVEQIVQAAGVAKGTFYHYFGSKDAVLEALVERFGDSLFGNLRDAAARPGTACQRLQAVMDAAAAFKSSQADLSYASFLYREENLALRHRLFQAWREQAREVLVPVITAGTTDGSFTVTNPDAATDVVLLLWFDAPDHLWDRAATASAGDEFAEILLTGAQAIYEAQERILGVAPGTFAMPFSSEVVDLTKQVFVTLDRTRP